MFSFLSLVVQMVKHLSTMRETRVRSLGPEDPLEKEMATPSSTIAWKIPWMEKPGRVQSMGSQRVGHDWAISLQLVPLLLVLLSPSKTFTHMSNYLLKTLLWSLNVSQQGSIKRSSQIIPDNLNSLALHSRFFNVAGFVSFKLNRVKLVCFTTFVSVLCLCPLHWNIEISNQILPFLQGLAWKPLPQASHLASTTHVACCRLPTQGFVTAWAKE